MINRPSGNGSLEIAMSSYQFSKNTHVACHYVEFKKCMFRCVNCRGPNPLDYAFRYVAPLDQTVKIFVETEQINT